MSQKAQEGNTVQVHYTGTLEDGSIFDSSKDREPLQFVVGSGMVIAGFDDAVTGLTEGETITAIIPAEKAYGKRHDEMILILKKQELPPDMDPKLGDRYQVPQPDGRVAMLRVTEINTDTVTLDANHELAGHDLTFEITLVKIM